MLPGQSCPQDGPAREQTSRTCLLSLPTEIRQLIYGMLFSDLKITIQASQSPYRGPDAIMHASKAFYHDCLSIFYKLVTIILKHEAYLYLLHKKIGHPKMALIRNLAVCGFDYRITERFMLQLPSSLQKLCIGWKGGTCSYDGRSGWEWPASDEFVRSQLHQSCRSALDSLVKTLWAKNPNLEISIEGWIGKAPSKEVCLLSFTCFC